MSRRFGAVNAGDDNVHTIAIHRDGNGSATVQLILMSLENPVVIAAPDIPILPIDKGR